MQQKVWFIDRLTLPYKCMQHSGCFCLASMPAFDMHYIICCPTFPAVSDGGPMWHLVCSQVRLSAAAGWIPGVRQVNWSQCMHIERLCIECLRLICITLSIVRRFLQYPMADQLWHLVCSQVRIPGAAGWIPGVRQVNWSQFMHIERLCIERHCIERHCIVCFLFRPCLRSSWSGLFACVVAPDLHRGLHLSTAHRRTTVHLNAYACHCKIRLYPLSFCVLR